MKKQPQNNQTKPSTFTTNPIEESHVIESNEIDKKMTN